MKTIALSESKCERARGGERTGFNNAPAGVRLRTSDDEHKAEGSR